MIACSHEHTPIIQRVPSATSGGSPTDLFVAQDKLQTYSRDACRFADADDANDEHPPRTLLCRPQHDADRWLVKVGEDAQFAAVIEIDADSGDLDKR